MKTVYKYPLEIHMNSATDLDRALKRVDPALRKQCPRFSPTLLRGQTSRPK